MSQLTSKYLSSKKPGWLVMFQNVVVFSTQDRQKRIRIRLKHEKVGAIYHGMFCIGELTCLRVFCSGPFCALNSSCIVVKMQVIPSSQSLYCICIGLPWDFWKGKLSPAGHNTLNGENLDGYWYKNAIKMVLSVMQNEITRRIIHTF